MAVLTITVTSIRYSNKEYTACTLESDHATCAWKKPASLREFGEAAGALVCNRLWQACEQVEKKKQERKHTHNKWHKHTLCIVLYRKA